MKTALLEDLLIEVIDHRGKTPKKLGTDFVPSGVPVASAQLVSGGVLDLSDCRFVDEATWQRWMPTPLRVDDILLTSEAPLGRTARVQSSDPLVLGQRLFALRARADLLAPAYLYYWLSSQEGQAALAEQATGSTVLGIRQSALRRIKVPVPAIEEQRAIGEVLGALDDKIAANQRVVAVCDQLRSQLWNRACASDRNELPLSSLARFVNGRAFTKDASGTGRIVIRIAELNSGIGASTVRNDIQVADDHVARPGDLLLAWSGSLTSARWFREEAIVNQHIFNVIPNSDSEMWAVASAVDSKLADFKEIAKDKATTMGHIRRADLDQPVGWPAVSEEVGEAGQRLWSRALSAEMENEVLARTRDDLLPLLMNGRITVKDAEQAAEAVL